MKIDEIIQQPGEKERTVIDNVMDSLHVAAPGEVVSYNSDTRTAVIQLTVRRHGSRQKPPILQDVPVFFPGNILFPVNPGDECLVVFADSCIDAWFSQSGVSSAPLARRHDLSDGFAFVGFFSRKKASGGIDIITRLNQLERKVETLLASIDA